ncbi:sugar ABC transporter permease [Spirochaetia bacterium]|nr:sugar ABC transporter permease [Spirochaetia bacterium]GHU31162.1 sugar ABC transporter permease [Spirochaetia bacterium]
MKTSPGRKLFLIIAVIFLTFISLVCVLPFLNLLAISLSNKNAVSSGQVSFLPVDFTLSSYTFITNNSAFVKALWVSIQRVILGVGINLVLIVLTAYPLSKEKNEFRLRSVFSWFFVITILFNGGLIPSYLIVRYTGIRDTIWALVLPGAVPVFSMLVVMNYMRSLPKELSEAAYIDGANHFDTLFRVILPVSTPTIATVALFAFVGHWNSWFDGLIYMAKVDHYPLQTYLQTVVIKPEVFFMNSTNISQSLITLLSMVDARTTAAAQLFLGTIPILCVYPFLQKYFASGLVIGSVKG